MCEHVDDLGVHGEKTVVYAVHEDICASLRRESNNYNICCENGIKDEQLRREICGRLLSAEGNATIT